MSPPTYVYLCQKCGAETSVFAKINEYQQTHRCETCGEAASIKPSWQGPYGIGGDNSASTVPKGRGHAGK
jgi:putative FmdB family regulatory protein